MLMLTACSFQARELLHSKPIFIQPKIDIQTLADCYSINSQSKKAIALIPQEKTLLSNLIANHFSSWNHIATPLQAEYLKSQIDNYQATWLVTDEPTCANTSILQMTLIKKLANWDQQHVNGVEFKNLGNADITFERIQFISLDLKINRQNTFIPSPLAIQKKYQQLAPSKLIDALDKGKVNLGLTLYEKNDTNLIDHKASVIFEIDQNTLSDQWLRINIPASHLQFYVEQNYQKTPQKQTELTGFLVNNLVLVAETSSGSVLRKIATHWSSDIPELYKEVGVSLRNVVIHLDE